MKAMASIFMVMLLLSTNIENEGGLKMVEGTRFEKTLFKVCTDILNNNCGDMNQCLNLCRKKYGFLASGECNNKKQCVCTHPC
ncbi:Knottin [Vigna unguiculata]|uniref:Knottin n=1 Tax=Vigna unguiculata TaxID=3917 RepID=A0A4D6M6E0_VIGUN|nr:Knottin [Vigna unguiculata]